MMIKALIMKGGDIGGEKLIPKFPKNVVVFNTQWPKESLNFYLYFDLQYQKLSF